MDDEDDDGGIYFFFPRSFFRVSLWPGVSQSRRIWWLWWWSTYCKTNGYTAGQTCFLFRTLTELWSCSVISGMPCLWTSRYAQSTFGAFWQSVPKVVQVPSARHMVDTGMARKNSNIFISKTDIKTRSHLCWLSYWKLARHIATLPQERSIWQVLQWCPAGKYRMGRPRFHWESTLESYCKYKGLGRWIKQFCSRFLLYKKREDLSLYKIPCRMDACCVCALKWLGSLACRPDLTGPDEDHKQILIF